jgi:hypothetical protein
VDAAIVAVLYETGSSLGSEIKEEDHGAKIRLRLDRLHPM